MDRHVIANMGAELGATTTVFPSDAAVQRFLMSQGRGNAWVEIAADADATYDKHEEINLSALEPLIACPSSPDNVVPVCEVTGREIYQAYIGSSANPGLRDFAIAALMVDGRQVCDWVSFDINPTSRQILENLTHMGLLAKLIRAGARLHQAGCNGCIGMGQAPATGRISLRTVPRNFPGRSGTQEDQVYLCSPETATASALTGVITDLRTLGRAYPTFVEPAQVLINAEMLVPPAPAGEPVALVKGPNIVSLPSFDPLPETVEGPVLLKLSDHISTDEILPAGEQVLPLRSNLPALSRFVFAPIDATYYERAMQYQHTGSLIVAGRNYGQGSSREHAALAPRYLGVRAVLAQSFARIHWQNLVNCGMLPLTLMDPTDWHDIDQGDVLRVLDVRQAICHGTHIAVQNQTKHATYMAAHTLSDRQVKIILAGSLINLLREHHTGRSRASA
jgi:aconitate hydratase